MRILEFSGANEPGVWYLGKCLFKISCEVSSTGPDGSKSFTAEGYGENLIGSLSDENMDQLLNQTYADFLTNLEKELIKAGY